MTERAQLRLLFILLGVVCLGVTAMMAISALKKEVTAGQDNGAGGKDQTGSSRDESTPGASHAAPTLFDQPLELTEFTLTDQTGQPFGSAQLKGKVWIASFIFTRCPTICPRVIAQTAQLQSKFRELKDASGAALADRIMLVSLSVDPLHDSPKRLTETAELWNADARQWRFLTTTDREHMWELIRSPRGFRQSVGEAAPGEQMIIVHTSKFVLVDAQHRIRGFYDSLDETDRKRLLADVDRLLSSASP